MKRCFLSLGLIIVINVCLAEKKSVPDNSGEAFSLQEDPVSSFVSSDFICFGDYATINYTGTASPDATYNWDFDGAISIIGIGEESYEVFWYNSGEKTISLQVTENGVTSSVSTNIVIVNSELESSFLAPPMTCVDEFVFVEFNGIAPAEATYTWNFDGASIISGAGQGPYEVSWDTSGEKFISLEVAENGCASYITEYNVTVSPELRSSFVVSSINCENKTAILEFNGIAPPGTIYTWYLDGGNIISENNTNLIEVQWGSLGVKSLALTLEYNGCLTDFSDLVDLGQSPTSSFTSNNLVCFGDTTTINYTGNAPVEATYTWNFNDASIISGSGQGPYEVSWKTSGEKTISLQVTENGCSSSITENNVTVSSELESSFIVDSIICEDETAILEFNGLAPAGAIYTWELDGGNVISYGDSTIIEVQWSILGQKEISLIIEYNGCVSNLYSAVINYNPIPTSSFEINNVNCFEDTTTINYIGTASAEATYNWSFDGASIISGAGQGPYEVSWDTSGEKAISLEVIENGCSNTSSQSINIIKTPTADFSVQTFICEGGSAIVSYEGNGADTATYTWDFDNATIISGEGSGPYEISWDSFGSKNISLSVLENVCVSETVTKSIEYNQYPTLAFEAGGSVCYNQNYQINFTGENYSEISWSFDGANVISGTGAGPYVLSWNNSGDKLISLIASNMGCLVDTTIVVNVQPEPYTPEICMITVDQESSKNMLVWNYGLETVSQFGIYRETNISGEYSLVEYIDGGPSNTYIDMQSSPEQQSNRYKITSVDSCGTETELSAYHKTIHLTINKGLSDSWNLIWDGYEGLSFGTYKIYRSLNDGDFQLLAEVASSLSSYTDSDVSTEKVAYQIEVVNPNSCDSNSSGRMPQSVTIKSNIARNNTVTGLSKLENSLTLYPNPIADYLYIKLDNNIAGEYYIHDLSGQIVESGTLKGHDKINMMNTSSGIYLLSIKTNNGLTWKRIVKE